MYILLFSQTLFSSGITNILGYLLVKKQHPDSFGEKVCDEPWRANELSQRTFLFSFRHYKGDGVPVGQKHTPLPEQDFFEKCVQI